MTHKIAKLHRSLSIEMKTIFGIIVFTLFIVALERYQISQNIIEQFVESKKSKNNLLINTISPIIGLNISLGLESANKEYLDYIAEQNSDIEFIELKDLNNRVIYSYGKDDIHIKKKNDIDFCDKKIKDSISKEALGTIHIHFSDNDYKSIVSKNRELTLKISFITFVLLGIFLYLIKREFKYLSELSENVLSYDPKLNNFTATPSERSDEVGVIHNAIISMVTKITNYTKILDDINASLEDKIQERTKELKEANRQLKALSVTDELTQLANRRYFEEYYEKSWELAKRKGVDISVIMCDIDYFKKVNDTYGHQAGDYILKKIALIMKMSLKRSSDFLARYGGEEFIIVMYDTKMDVAELLCKKIQDNLARAEGFEFQGIKLNHVTMSFGVCSTIPKKNQNPDYLVKLADDALYRAKENGRDCIVTSLL